MSNKKWKIGEKIVAFSEYLNFKTDKIFKTKFEALSFVKSDLILHSLWYLFANVKILNIFSNDYKSFDLGKQISRKIFFVSNFVGREMLALWAHLVSWRLGVHEFVIRNVCSKFDVWLYQPLTFAALLICISVSKPFDKIYSQTPADKRDTLCCYFSSRLVYFQVKCQLDILPQFQVSILTNFLHFKISNLKITKQIQSVLLCCWNCCLETI